MKMELDSRISGYRCSTWPRGEVRVSRTARMAAAVAVLLIMCVPASALAQVSGLQIGIGVRGGGATLIPNSQIDSHTTGGFGFAAAVTVELLDRIAFGPAATMYYSAHDFGEDVELDAIPAAVGLWVRVKTIELLTIGAHLTYTFPNLVIETNGEETHTGGAGVGAGIDALFAFQVGDNWLYSTFIEVGPYLTWCHFLEDVPYTPAINYFAYGLTVHITLDLEFD